MMVIEAVLAAKVKEILSSSDLKTTTNNIVINKLQSHFNVDLSHQKPLLRHLVDRFLQSQYYEDEDEADDDDDVVFDHANYGVSGNRHDHGNGGSGGGGGNDGDCVAVRVDDNVGGKFKGVDHNLERPGRENKEKIKKICFPGKKGTLSPELQKFLGVPHMTRAEVIKQLWTYVKEKRLQDPNDGKCIICDETLRDLLGVDTINILQINTALTKHIRPRVKSLKRAKPPTQEKEEEVKSLKSNKMVKQEQKEEGKLLKSDEQLKQEKEEEVNSLKSDKPHKQEEVVKLLPKDKPRKQGKEVKLLPKVKPRKQKREGSCEDEMNEKKKVLSGFLSPLPLSDNFKRFLGTGEIALTRPDAIKRVWQYIKHNKLQDPSDKKTIICDEKLKELFNVGSFNGFMVTKLLTPHMGKMSVPLTFSLPLSKSSD